MDDLARSRPSQLVLSIVTRVDAGRMRLNARKHGTRIISDRKAETRLAWRTRLRRRVIALCVTTTSRGPCAFVEKWYRWRVSRRGRGAASAGMLRYRVDSLANGGGRAMWRRRDVVGGQKCAWTRWAPVCGRQRKLIKRLSVYAREERRYTWTDWNWNTEVGLGACSNIMRITWAARSSLKVGIPLGLTCQVDSKRSAWYTERFICVIMSKSTLTSRCWPNFWRYGWGLRSCSDLTFHVFSRREQRIKRAARGMFVLHATIDRTRRDHCCARYEMHRDPMEVHTIPIVR